MGARAARVTAATLSDMYSAIVSAIGTLKGPLHGGAYAFALTAGRRVSGEAFLDDGSLVVGGDEEIALAVLQHVHAYVE